MDDAAKKAEANRKRSESMKRAWETGKGILGERVRREKTACKCGCGKLAEMGRLYAKGCYDPGAAHRGKKHGAEWKAKQAEGIKRAYSEGKMQHAVNQTPEFIEKRIRKLRGRKRPKDACIATGIGVRKAWAEGKYHTEAVINNRKVNLSRVGGTREQMDAIRGKRDMEKLKADNAERLKNQMKEWKQLGQLDDIRRKAGNAAGMLDHLAAKVWIIRDPYGNPHKFSNLAEWARQNEHRFVDDRPESRAPFWKRIAGGITDLLKKDGRSCSYRGWTAVSKLELDAGGMDLLGRDYFQQNAIGHAPGEKGKDHE
jgi:hypothetical protein